MHIPNGDNWENGRKVIFEEMANMAKRFDSHRGSTICLGKNKYKYTHL